MTYKEEFLPPTTVKYTPLLGYATTLNRDILDYQHTWEDKHRRVHYCHMGAKQCPICPAIYNGQEAVHTLIDICKILENKGLQLITDNKNHWQLLPIQ